MTSTTAPTAATGTVLAATPTPEQLTLLPERPVPVRFRLDEATRQRGLRHIAEIRARLGDPAPAPGRAAARGAAAAPRPPARSAA